MSISAHLLNEIKGHWWRNFRHLELEWLEQSGWASCAEQEVAPHTPSSERDAYLFFGRFSLQVPVSPGTDFLGLTNPKLLNALDFIFCAIRWSRLSALS